MHSLVQGLKAGRFQAGVKLAPPHRVLRVPRVAADPELRVALDEHLVDALACRDGEYVRTAAGLTIYYYSFNSHFTYILCVYI